MSDSPVSPSPEVPVPVSNPWLVAIAVMLATFMEVLDTSIASVALPYIAGSVSATNDEATWVLTSYLVANAIILPTSSWFSQRFGRKRFLLTCIVIFTISSFACGAADSLAMILIARARPGCRWRSLTAALAGHPARKLSAGQAWTSHGHLRTRCSCRPGPRPHRRRLAHRNLFLALGLLHQYSRRHARHIHDHALCA